MSEPTLFFSRTYEEAKHLLGQTRDYLAFVADDDLEGVSQELRLQFALESTRLTARLVNVMAWLLLQRAVHEGEISEREAANDAPNLRARKTCLAQPANEALPILMQELLEKSLRLYVRVSRLDEMVRRRLLESA